MKYSELNTTSIKVDHSLRYRLCYRKNPSKTTGKFVGLYNAVVPLTTILNFGYMSTEILDDLFSDDGSYMLVEVKNGDEKVILPSMLKKLLIKKYADILNEFHLYDNINGTMCQSCKKLLNKIDEYIA
jgi:hypothetical protein